MGQLDTRILKNLKLKFTDSGSVFRGKMVYHMSEANWEQACPIRKMICKFLLSYVEIIDHNYQFKCYQ